MPCVLYYAGDAELGVVVLADKHEVLIMLGTDATRNRVGKGLHRIDEIRVVFHFSR